MKNLITILLMTLLVANLSAQIEHIDYGEGLVISMNENVALDINEDGIIDFYLNQNEGELAFTPIFAAGCLLGTGNSTSFGTDEMQLMEPGELVDISSTSISLYIEDDESVPAFTNNVENGLADGWIDQEDHYIGFALVGGANFDGWMKLSIDIEAETLTIKEIAYKQSYNGGIQVGQTEEITTSVNPLTEVLNNVSVNPNPAKDFINLRFDYNGAEELTITILNNIGQELSRRKMNRQATYLEIPTNNWSPGLYAIRFTTVDGFYTKKVSVVK